MGRTKHALNLRAPRIVSCLAGGTPVRHPVVVPLPPRADPRAAARARLADESIDAMPANATFVDRFTHQFARDLERTRAIRVRDIAQTPPWRELRLPQRLGEPHVPDPGNERLVEERLTEPARLIGATVDQHIAILDRVAAGEDGLAVVVVSVPVKTSSVTAAAAHGMASPMDRATEAATEKRETDISMG